MTCRYYHRCQSLSWRDAFRMINFRTLLIVSACCLVGVAMAESPDYLYAGKTNVVKEYIPGLNDPRLLFMNVKAPRVVEFYSPHCPACIAFGPSYMKMAQNTKNLYPEIQFFAVSCDHYEDVCEQYDVHGFPTLRLFREDEDPSSKGKTAEFDDDHAENKRVPGKIADFLGVNSASEKKVPTEKDNKNGDHDASKSSKKVEEDKEPENPIPLDEIKLGDNDGDGASQSSKGGDDDDNSNKHENDDDDSTSKTSTPKDDGNDDDDSNNKNDDGGSTSTPKDDGNDDDDSNNKNDDGDSTSTSTLKDDGNDGDNSNNKNDDDDGIGNDDNDSNNKNDSTSNGKGAGNAGDNNDVKKSNNKNKNDDDDSISSSEDDSDKKISSDEEPDDDKPNEYSQFHKTDVENYLKRRQGLGKYIRRDDTKDKRGRTIEKSLFEETTKGMKQYTPGTREFEDRRQAMIERIRKGGRKYRLQVQRKDLTRATLPLKKDVTKPKWLKMGEMNSEEELILDITLSLTVGLSSGMAMGIEDVTSKAAMKNWLDLLSVSLPSIWNVHKLIDNLRMNFEQATESKDNFRDMVKSYPVARTGWSRSCQNRELGTEGFSCGFWKLLHVVTLGVAEQRGGKNLIDSGMMSPNTVVFSPNSAADTIRNYMDKFFTCRPCREHFLKTYDDCKNNQRCKRLTANKNSKKPAEWKELSLWLWDFHNDVSVRLAGERISKTFKNGVKNTPTGSDEVAVVWPNVNNCILCFESNGMWNKGEVFLFLEHTYWPDSETDPLTDKLLMFENEVNSRAGLLCFLAFLIIWMVYRSTAKRSDAIRQPLIASRLLLSQWATNKSRTS